VYNDLPRESLQNTLARTQIQINRTVAALEKLDFTRATAFAKTAVAEAYQCVLQSTFIAQPLVLSSIHNSLFGSLSFVFGWFAHNTRVSRFFDLALTVVGMLEMVRCDGVETYAPFNFFYLLFPMVAAVGSFAWLILGLNKKNKPKLN
jgi:hypothetical protein